ncbi:hypothetical protein ACET3Z_002614 [Daucus carota]
MAVYTKFALAVFVVLISTIAVSATGYEYNGVKPMPFPQNHFTQKFLPGFVAVQGLVYCKSGSKLIPLKGALARVTCLTTRPNGYEAAPVSISSSPTDAKGYFFITLSKLVKDGKRIKECKAFLEKSSMETCKVPTNINNGTSGALLRAPRLLKNINLYSVAPFFYAMH